MSKFLVFAHRGMGDVLMMAPALRQWRRRDPEARVTFTVRGSIEEQIIRRCGFFSDSRFVHFGYAMSTQQRFRSALKLIMETRVDHALIPLIGDTIPQRLVSKCVNARKVTAPKGRIWGVQCGSVESWRTDDLEHQADYYLRFFKDALQWTGDVQRTQTDHVLFEKDNSEVSPREILIGPGCGPREKFKVWPAERYAQLIKMLSEHFSDIPLAMYGSSSDIPLLSQIISVAGIQKKVAFYVGLSLEAILEKLSTARLVIAGASGPGHLAAASGAPLLVTETPTNPWLSGPLGQKTFTIFGEQYNCAPCFREGFYSGCGHSCMYDISAKDVFNGARALLHGEHLPQPPRRRTTVATKAERRNNSERVDA